MCSLMDFSLSVVVVVLFCSSISLLIKPPLCPFEMGIHTLYIVSCNYVTLFSFSNVLEYNESEESLHGTSSKIRKHSGYF